MKWLSVILLLIVGCGESVTEPPTTEPAKPVTAIYGYVNDITNSKPINNAEIGLKLWQGGSITKTWETKTNSTGRWSVSDYPPINYAGGLINYNIQAEDYIGKEGRYYVAISGCVRFPTIELQHK